MNTQVTKFKKRKSNIKTSEIFSVSDEAFAVMMIDNYEERWKLQTIEKDKKKWRSDPNYQAKYTSSTKGVHNNSWSEEGMKSFYDWCHKIQELRKDKKVEWFLKKRFWHIIVVSRMSLVIVYHQTTLRNQYCYMKNLLKMGGRI